GAAVDADLGLHFGAEAQRAGTQHTVVTKHIRLNFLRVFYREYRVAADDFAAVAHLAAGLGVERRMVEHDDATLAFIHLLHRAAFYIQRNDGRLFHQQLFIAAEGSSGTGVFERSRHLELASSASLITLTRHGRI